MLVRALLKDKSLVFAGFLLLAVIFLDFLFLYPTVSELDIFEHFLFGFVLSQFSSKAADSMALDELLRKRLEQKDPRRVDLLIRLIGFFLTGGMHAASVSSFLCLGMRLTVSSAFR